MVKLKYCMRFSKGFTLVELLVVIGVLGILALGLLATIDPIEQFKKGADSNKRASALELHNALTRYYTIHGDFPWIATASFSIKCLTLTQGVAYQASTTFLPCITRLQDVGELKTTFSTQTQIIDDLYVAQQTSSSGPVTVCFDPESKAESSSPQTNNKQTGELGCTPGAATSCFWCAK